MLTSMPPRSILAFVLVLSAVSFPLTNVSGCMYVSSPDTYVLNQSLSGTGTASGGLVPGSATCLLVTSPDVVIDCAGFTIDGGLSADTSIGIGVDGPAANITIVNCTNITGHDYGVFFQEVNSSAITRSVITARTGTTFGVYLNSSYYNNITNLSIDSMSYNPQSYGICLNASPNNTVAGNMVRASNAPGYGSGGYGLYVRASPFSNVSNNTILAESTGLTYGIILNQSQNSSITGTYAFGTFAGLYALSSQGTAVRSFIGNNSRYYGIYFNGSPNVVIVNSTGFATFATGSTRNCGICLYSSSQSAITDSFGILVGATNAPFYGIYLNNSMDCNVSGSYGFSNSTSVTFNGGISLEYSHNAIITNTSGSAMSGNGFYFVNDNFTTLVNSSGSSDSGRGVEFGSSNNSAVYNLTGTSNSSQGIIINSGSNNTFEGSLGASNSQQGIYLGVLSSRNNTFTNCTGMSDSSVGIEFSASVFNFLINSTGISNSSQGIYLHGSGSGNNNSVHGCAGYSNLSYGIAIGSSDYNVITNSTGVSVSGDGLGIIGSGTDYNNVTNCTGISDSGNGLSVYISSGSVDDTLVIGSEGRSNSGSGIYCYNADRTDMSNSTGRSVSGPGFLSYYGNYNRFADVLGISESGNGTQIRSNTDNNLTNVQGVSESGNGIVFVAYTNRMKLTNCTGTSGSGHGILIDYQSDNNNLTNCTGTSGSGHGILINALSMNALLASSTGISPAGCGVLVNSSSSATVANGTESGNALGICVNASTVMVSGERIFNNSVGVFVTNGSQINLSGVVFGSPGGAMQNFTNISLNDTVNSGESYSINWSSNESALPPGYQSFAWKFVNISAAAGTANLTRAVWHWASDELGGYNESAFVLASFNGTWALQNISPDTASNELSLSGFVPHTIFGILENGSNESAPPVIITVPDSPANGSSFNTTSVSVGFHFTDTSYTAANCSLYLDSVLNRTNSSTLNGTMTAMALTGIAEGNHTWYVRCTDAANVSSAGETRTFLVDTPPAVILGQPDDGAVLASGNVTFGFTPHDNLSAELACSLYLDGSLNGTNTSSMNNTETFIQILGIAEGAHEWIVECVDGSANAGMSLTWDFSIALPTADTPEDDEEDPVPELEAAVSTSCEGNVVSVLSAGDPVSGAEVEVDGEAAGRTGIYGMAIFSGCGKTVIVRAEKSGYRAASAVQALVACDSCKPPETHESEPSEPACPCSSDSGCGFGERCEVAHGETCGECVPVSGECGEARDHVFVPYGYACGSEPGCPSCPPGVPCINHTCVTNDLKGPDKVVVGQNGTIEAKENEEPCPFCDLEIISPQGVHYTGRTDAAGRFVLPFRIQGVYNVSLMRDGKVVRSIMIEAFPLASPAEPEKPFHANPEEPFPWWLLILLLVMIVLVVYWRRRKGERNAAPGKVRKAMAAAKPEAGAAGAGK
jgi:hypothetical protein